MKKLIPEDRPHFDGVYRTAGHYSFYHYFPLMYALSESTTSLFTEEIPQAHLNIYVNKSELYLLPDDELVPDTVRKVWVSTKHPPETWQAELYDVNFIYDLRTTLAIKNFRSNVKKFERDNPNTSFEPCTPKEALMILEDWYYKHKRVCSDFGYTMWLGEHFDLFKDLRGWIAKGTDGSRAISLWGELSNDSAVHLVCKDLGEPYLQDWTRYQTYYEMLEAGFKYCNDGGDAGEYGINVYKHKLRPKFIIPIYSWVRK